MKNLLLIFTIIILTGCSINDNITIKNQQKENQIKKIENNSFDRKKECASFYKNILTDISQNYPNRDNTFDQILYSPSRNSCLYAFYSDDYFINKKSENDSRRWYFIFDYFTKELIYTSSMIIVNRDGLEKELEFYDKIKELKNK